MPTPNRHIIQRQVFELELESETGAFDTQQYVSRMYQERVLPQLSRLFDELAPSDIVRRINKLEIDLGEVRLENLEATLTQAIQEQLQNVLQAEAQTKQHEVQKLNAPIAKIELLFFFLQYGRLPWWADEEQAAQILQNLSDTIAAAPNTSREQLKTWIVEAVQLFRTIYQVKKEFQTALEAFRQHTKTTIFRRLLLQWKEEELLQVLQQLFEKEWQNIAIPLEQMRSAFQSPKQLPNWIPKAKQLEWQNLDSSIAYITLYLSILEYLIYPVNERILSANPNKANAVYKIPETEITQTDFEATTKTLESEQKENLKAGYYIENGGLVLLAPYLGLFLKSVNLVADGQFVNEAAQHRALHLLQYLAGYDEFSPEYALVLNKVLCNVPFSQPVQRDIMLSETEKMEAEDLLKAVIQHWTVLKNTTPAGLQETFLQRRAKLSYRDSNNTWLLQVERKSYDVLLDKIPWGFARIKLPWMPELLRVEWG